MTHTYNINGVTCSSCEQKVRQQFLTLNEITGVEFNKEKDEVSVSMNSHVTTAQLQQTLKNYPKYQLNEKNQVHVFEQDVKSWFNTYKPVLLIFAFITGVSLLIQLKNASFNTMQWMSHFMAGFFLTFSFFKLLNLQGFADSFAMYDIVAKRWKSYAYLYAFIELALGLAYLLSFNPFITNSVAFLVMSVSLIGVLESIFNKRKIKCACLGDVFNLPMSTITIIEDSLMIIMSGIMIFN